MFARCDQQQPEADRDRWLSDEAQHDAEEDERYHGSSVRPKTDPGAGRVGLRFPNFNGSDSLLPNTEPLIINPQVSVMITRFSWARLRYHNIESLVLRCFFFRFDVIFFAIFFNFLIF